VQTYWGQCFSNTG